MKRLVCLAGLAAALGAAGFGQQQGKAGTAEINGQVTAAGSKAGLRAVVTWVRQITDEATGQGPVGVVGTDANGGFQITGLAAGTYVLCATTPGQDYVDPCVWEANPPRVTVKSGQKANNASIEAGAGVLLKFEVTDLEKKVAGKGKSVGTRLRATVALPEGRWVELPLARTVGDVHVLEAMVPADRDLPLVVEGAGLLFSDEAGRPWGQERAAYVIKKSAAGTKEKRTAVEVKGR
ncbi:MAG: carboxypeptidase regulatory-like domain-containing protein [Candidatus Solibacter usitatus]|nr:carboxypeptidase regulatory-like domain-containing protein [Candidatus Solibacter usitatus]